MVTYLGHKVRPATADKVVAQLAFSLLPGEEILFIVKCNNLRPMTDHVIVTDRRLVGRSSTKAISVEFSYSEPLSYRLDGNAETLRVDGPRSEMLFKMVQREDHAYLRSTLDWARARFAERMSARTDLEAPHQMVLGRQVASVSDHSTAESKANRIAEQPGSKPKGVDLSKPSQASTVPSTRSRRDNLVSQLRELGELHHQGILTDVEFGNAKKRLLDE